MNKQKSILTGLIIVAVLIVYAVTFTVQEGKLAVLTVMGKASDKNFTPGLYFKPPWPFSEIYLIDARADMFSGTERQVLTSDQNSFTVKSHVLWKVQPDQVNMFWQNVKTAEEFKKHLSGLLESHQNSIIGRRSLKQIFPEGAARGGVIQLEKELLTALATDCKEQYGVEILMVGFDKIVLSETVMQKVFDKMTSERNTESETLKAEGEAEAKEILAKAKSLYEQELAKVSGEVKQILGEAEAKSQEYYKILAKNPELYLNLKKIEAMEKMLKERATLVVDPNMLPVDILKSK